jgi:hypothetical protein
LYNICLLSRYNGIVCPYSLDFSPSPKKSINSSIFSFFSNSSASHFRSGQYLEAYRGWTYACVNAIAEAFAEIELKLQEKTKDGWQDMDDHEALDLLHKVNKFHSFLDLTYAT